MSVVEECGLGAVYRFRIGLIDNVDFNPFLLVRKLSSGFVGNLFRPGSDGEVALPVAVDVLVRGGCVVTVPMCAAAFRLRGGEGAYGCFVPRRALSRRRAISGKPAK